MACICLEFSGFREFVEGAKIFMRGSTDENEFADFSRN
jgi:hypothetical protein